MIVENLSQFSSPPPHSPRKRTHPSPSPPPGAWRRSVETSSAQCLQVYLRAQPSAQFQ